jgi:plastocyanin
VVATTLLAPARAADLVMTAVGNTYVPGDLRMTAGSKLTFTNADAAPHNVIADATGRSGPIFGSALVTAGQSAEVKGVDKLKPATYTFYCSLHPQMRGSLIVTGPATETVTVPTPVGSVPTPTSVAFYKDALYVTSYAAGTVTQLPVLPGGALGPGTPFATGFEQPLGVAFAPDGTMYVADSHAAGSARHGRVWAVKGSSKKVVVDGLPNGRHNTNNLAVANNRLYVTNGNSTDDGVTGGPKEQPLSGTVLSYALPIKPKAKPTVESKGLRNVYDVAVRPGTTTDLWFATNGPDALDPYGEDLLHRVDARKGPADYGFPACVYAAGLKRGQNPAIAKKCKPAATPVLALGLHVSANGLAFGTGGAWGDDLYIAEYGSNVPSPAGHRVVRVPITNGRAGAPEDVVVGPAPIDVVFGPEGLYVADFNTGALTLLRAVAA